MLQILIPYIDHGFSEFTEKIGLVQRVTEKREDATKRYPAVLVGNGQFKQVDLDRVVSYHRLRGPRTVEFTENNTSGCTRGVRIVYPMYFVGMVKNDCQYSNDTITNKMANGLIVTKFPKSVRSQILAWFAEVEVTDINEISESVFEQEYTNVDLNIDHSYCLFSIGYNIIIEADSRCLDLGCNYPCSSDAILSEEGECLYGEENSQLIVE